MCVRSWTESDDVHSRRGLDRQHREPADRKAGVGAPTAPVTPAEERTEDERGSEDHAISIHTEVPDVESSRPRHPGRCPGRGPGRPPGPSGTSRERIRSCEEARSLLSLGPFRCWCWPPRRRLHAPPLQRGCRRRRGRHGVLVGQHPQRAGLGDTGRTHRRGTATTAVRLDPVRAGARPHDDRAAARGRGSDGHASSGAVPRGEGDVLGGELVVGGRTGERARRGAVVPDRIAAITALAAGPLVCGRVRP